MTLPVPVIDERDFQQLFEEAVARIPVHTPEWSNFNDSDPGITIIQLFAFMTENLLYRSNRIPERNRLKFLSLLGIGLRPPMPGRGIVMFRNERGPIKPHFLARGTELRAGSIPFRTRHEVNILPVEAAVFFKGPQEFDDQTHRRYVDQYRLLLPDTDYELQFYETRQLEAPIIGKQPDVVSILEDTIDESLWIALLAPKNVPIEFVRAAIARQTLSLGIYPENIYTDEKILEPQQAGSSNVCDPGLIFEILSPDLKQIDDENPIPPANYRRLTVDFAEAVLEKPGIVQVVLPELEILQSFASLNFEPIEEGIGDYPPLLEDPDIAARVVTWLRVRVPGSHNNSLTRRARLSWIGCNASRVIQAMPVQDERIGVGTGTPEQTYRLAHTPIITQSLAQPGLPPQSSIRLQVQQTDGQWEDWELTEDIYTASWDDAVFELDPNSGIVTFGDGLRGRRPPPGSQIRVSYEYGGGVEGNVNIDMINKCAVLPGGLKVTNPLPTWGGEAPEAVAEGEKRIAHHLQHRDRLVTTSDFEEITKHTPGVDIERVEVLPLFHPDYSQGNATQTFPGTVTVLVIPDHPLHQIAPPRPDRLFLDAVCQWLDSRRLITSEVHVRAPQYVQLWLTVGLTTLPGFLQERVYQDVKLALRTYLSPLKGSPTEEGWELYTEVRYQDLEAVAVRVRGVRYVNRIRMGILKSGVIEERETASIEGMQLPWLTSVSVVEGDAEDLQIYDYQEMDSPNFFHVPVQPKKC